MRLSMMAAGMAKPDHRATRGEYPDDGPEVTRLWAFTSQNHSATQKPNAGTTWASTASVDRSPPNDVLK